MDLPSIAFGPVPSRRLGQSLGINNIPPKACTYSCSYCQVGETPVTSLHRREFYPAGDVVEAVAARLAQVRARGERVDFLTFVPDGEPTLDVHLGEEIEALRPLGVPIAVITNASLAWQPAVREELRRADWVSVKVDTVDEEVWRKLNRPHPSLRLEVVLEGILRFAGEFDGELVSETMLVGGVNDAEECVGRTADFLARVKPRKAYLLVPTRPPAEDDVGFPSREALLAAYRSMAERLPVVEMLTGEESGSFGSTGDAESDLLATASVHPMREEAVREILALSDADWSLVQRLLDSGRLAEVEHRGQKFYVRRPAARTR